MKSSRVRGGDGGCLLFIYLTFFVGFFMAVCRLLKLAAAQHEVFYNVYCPANGGEMWWQYKES